MPLYENWMDKCKGLGGAKLRHASQFYTNLPIHVLPGDESLVIPFLATLTAHIRRVGGNIELIRFLEPATILFHLVIIRVYLGRSPTDDDQIFTLAQEGRIIRQLTVPEQAMAAGESSEDTQYPPLPHCEVCVIGIKLDPHLTIPADFPLATAHTSNQQAYIWSASDKQGLSGGPSYNTYLHPQLWVVDPSIPRLKPKPTYGKRKIVVAKTSIQRRLPNTTALSRVSWKDKEVCLHLVRATVLLGPSNRGVSQENERNWLNRQCEEVNDISTHNDTYGSLIYFENTCRILSIGSGSTKACPMFFGFDGQFWRKRP